MKNCLLNYDKKALKIIQKIGREADKKGLSAYVVGGVVRDILLKRKNFDIDIVVEGDAIVFARGLEKEFGVEFVFYKKFGTATAVFPGNFYIDLVSARKESYPFPGALPTVRRGPLKADLFRRDFTINAMAVSINYEDYGTLVDEWGGFEDLKAQKVRILHDKSFIDDPTRILRAVRFEQRFDFKIERHTLCLLKNAVKNNYLSRVKSPRYFEEFKKILCEDNPVKGLRRLKKIGTGCFWLSPDQKSSLAPFFAVYNSIDFIKKNTPSVWLIYFMALMSKASFADQQKISEKFQFKKDEKASMLQSSNVEGILKALSVKRLSASEVYRILKFLRAEVVLYLRVQTKKKIVCQRIDQFWNQDRNIELRITGEDLKQMGICSGKKLGEILEKILYQKIDKGLQTKKEELKFIAAQGIS